MRKQTTIAAVAALALAGFTAAPASAAPAPVQTAAVAQATDLQQVRTLILQQTNQQRAAAGLPALRASASLDAFAQDCTKRQADARSIFHCDPPADFGRAWAENVAFGQSPDRVVAAWMASPGHRANILNPRDTHLGVGYALDADGRTHFTQNFQLPR
jgi:uncharacterized protein YkwD